MGADTWDGTARRVAALPGIRSAAVTLTATPVEIEARTDDGRWVYFHARHDQVWLGVGEDVDTACVNEEGATRLTLAGAGRFATGYLGPDESYHAFALLWSRRREWEGGAASGRLGGPGR
ncbi:hypothetical protein [Marinitenerispora sediminis]|uniref:hypothetical protein n=1 Tax=Marinitenerispora sediminis TaxID=1931232 RepID=UPI0015F14F17|nr:hypothetical protein [Marinitenerispora sediminis]